MTTEAKAQKLGYIRVSSLTQNTDRQLDGFEFDYPPFTDRLSGKDTNRPELKKLMDYARRGDTVYVHELSRLGRNLDDLRQIVQHFNAKGVTVHFVKENMIFSTDKANPMTELLFNIMAAFAQFERQLINERQREGVQLAKARGAYKGRKQEMTEERIAELKRRVESGEPKAVVAKAMKISRDTLYRYLNA